MPVAIISWAINNRLKIKARNPPFLAFGGHKGQAENDLRAAYISLRKALYFRLYQDTH
jgi:hypothetical protein